MWRWGALSWRPFWTEQKIIWSYWLQKMMWNEKNWLAYFGDTQWSLSLGRPSISYDWTFLCLHKSNHGGWAGWVLSKRLKNMMKKKINQSKPKISNKFTHSCLHRFIDWVISMYHGRFEKHWNLQYLNYMFFCCKQSCSFLNTLITYFPRFNWNFEIEEIFADDLCLCDEKIWWGCPRPHLLSHGWSAKCQPASFHKSIGNTKSWRKNLERNCESLNLRLVHSRKENVELVSNMSANVFQKINQKNKPAKSWWKNLGKFTFRTGTQHWGGGESVWNSSYISEQYYLLLKCHGWSAICQPSSFEKSIRRTIRWRFGERTWLRIGKVWTLVHSIG